jgi:ribosome-associated toxin RatA of RatAB toxin-antitoxin module
MSQVIKTVLVPYSAKAMFELVDAVETYPAFLPWCGATTVHSRDETHTKATIDIRYFGVAQSFTTFNTKVLHSQMNLTLVDGPFKSLDGRWQFLALSETACKVIFELNYTFANAPIEKIIGPVMSMIAETFVDRFVARAEALSL